MEPALASGKRSAGETDQLSTSIQDYRGKLEELEARVVTCGPKCEKARSCLGDNIGKLNSALAKLRPSARSSS